LLDGLYVGLLGWWLVKRMWWNMKWIIPSNSSCGCWGLLGWCHETNVMIYGSFPQIPKMSIGKCPNVSHHPTGMLSADTFSSDLQNPNGTLANPGRHSSKTTVFIRGCIHQF
jgi:hypothetical protein